MLQGGSHSRWSTTCPEMPRPTLVDAQVVGDLAQFMVQNNLTEASIVDQADQLSIPNRSLFVP